MRKKMMISLSVAVIMMLVVVTVSANVQSHSMINPVKYQEQERVFIICEEETCSNSRLIGSSYCSAHTCSLQECVNRKNASDEMCKFHRERQIPVKMIPTK